MADDEIDLGYLLAVCLDNKWLIIIITSLVTLMGAAYAMFGSMGLMQAVQLYIGIKLTRVPLNLIKLSLLFLVLFAETAFLYYLYALDLAWPLEVLCKMVMLALFPAMCFATGIATSGDMKFFADIIKEKLAGLKGTPGQA